MKYFVLIVISVAFIIVLLGINDSLIEINKNLEVIAQNSAEQTKIFGFDP